LSFHTLRWTGESLFLIDQTRLPAEEVYHEYTDPREVARAITDMIVRGAPAIGVTAAYGIALAAQQLARRSSIRPEAMEEIFETFRRTRPTAVNLFWAVERMRGRYLTVADREAESVARAMEAEACAVHEEDVAANRAMGRYGAALLPPEGAVLTHCNAGALATADFGTALGVIRAAVGAGKKIRVYADETRPFLQGARLTAWELLKDEIPVTLICDNMAGYLMKLGRVDAVIVGADRIAANGDTANKIGTYTVSVLARTHNIPFYVAAPLSTIDFSLETGESIPIEERSPDEVTHSCGRRIAPEGVEVWNPSFDVTPAGNISAIITERGVARPPYRESLAALKGAPAPC
jgi:methylthioribose-1-phosphate isomerase